MTVVGDVTHLTEKKRKEAIAARGYLLKVCNFTTENVSESQAYSVSGIKKT